MFAFGLNIYSNCQECNLSTTLAAWCCFKGRVAKRFSHPWLVAVEGDSNAERILHTAERFCIIVHFCSTKFFGFLELYWQAGTTFGSATDGPQCSSLTLYNLMRDIVAKHFSVDGTDRDHSSSVGNHYWQPFLVYFLQLFLHIGLWQCSLHQQE